MLSSRSTEVEHVPAPERLNRARARRGRKAPSPRIGSYPLCRAESRRPCVGRRNGSRRHAARIASFALATVACADPVKRKTCRGCAPSRRLYGRRWSRDGHARISGPPLIPEGMETDPGRLRAVRRSLIGQQRHRSAGPADIRQEKVVLTPRSGFPSRRQASEHESPAGGCTQQKSTLLVDHHESDHWSPGNGRSPGSEVPSWSDRDLQESILSWPTRQIIEAVHAVHRHRPHHDTEAGASMAPVLASGNR